jgi:hypothetical protein
MRGGIGIVVDSGYRHASGRKINGGEFGVMKIKIQNNRA